MTADMPDYIDELRGIAKALRELTEQQASTVHLRQKAGAYLKKAIELGAFKASKWVGFRTEAEQWFVQDRPFVGACHWLNTNHESIDLSVDIQKGDKDFRYWALLLADLIDEDAVTFEKRHQIALEQAARIPKNIWKAFHHWWQHNLYATVVVIVVGSASAIGGLIAFVRELLRLFGHGG